MLIFLMMAAGVGAIKAVAMFSKCSHAYVQHYVAAVTFTREMQFARVYGFARSFSRRHHGYFFQRRPFPLAPPPLRAYDSPLPQPSSRSSPLYMYAAVLFAN